ncbi:MAG: CotH kinase family protein [Reichenbachiella sp.]
MKNSLFLLISLFLSFQSVSQTLVDSNLPIVIITIDGSQGISDDPRVNGDMKIIFRGEGERNYVADQNTDDYLDFNGRIEIETRGSSSNSTEKKQYGFSTLEDDDSDTDNVSLLGMPKENDWILNGLAFDASLVRDYISYNLSRQIGEYAPRTEFCEVIINGNYRGLYILQEKVKADGDRVDINKIEELDNTQPELSGGYITKIDRPDEGDDAAWSFPTYSGQSADFVHVVPKTGDVTNAQENYIKNEFNKLANTSSDGNFSLSNGYPSVIDIPSFVDFMLINELSSNVDAYRLSTYFHKDRNGKLRAGPIWDSNLTFGNDLFFWSLDRSHTDVWQFSFGNQGPYFWQDLYDETSFRCQMSKRWDELTQPDAPLNLNSIENLIDETVNYIAEAESRDWDRWFNYQYSRSEQNQPFDSEIANMKRWISERITWMTENLGSFEACANPIIPSLVISKINYRPSGINSSSQEFIEITNNGNQEVDLTGVYFGGTGLVYQFPVNSAIGAGEALVLANNSIVYEQKYDEAPFDEYSRSLSNDGQTISLLDGFGNLIDEVTYNDQLPWPVEADGDGYYLSLTDLNLDNDDALNWMAVEDFEYITEAEDLSEPTFSIYPNPVNDALTIKSNKLIHTLAILDMQGRYLQIEGIQGNTHRIDTKGLKSGIYFVELITEEIRYVHRIVKD